jgi:type III pantothenate kinase
MKYIACDIGNTRIKAGLFHDFKLEKCEVFTELNEVIDFIFTSNVYNVVFSTVVPDKGEEFHNRLSRNFAVTRITEPANILIDYATPETLGIDRICASEGAYFLYCQMNKLNTIKKNEYILTADLGTATTINILREPNIFIGGMIAPGIRMMFNSLYTNTAQLPEVSVDDFNDFIGNSTKGSIASGVLISTIALVEKAIKYLYEDLKAENVHLFITGGNSDFLTTHLKHSFYHEETLNLYGIQSIFLKKL